jgi:glycosyltransferase involved in cell wall biosynthesis
MKILHVFDFFSPAGGGTVDVINKLARAQAQKGHEVSIYTSDFKLDKGYIASLPEVKIYPFHCVSSLGLFYVTPSLAKAAREHLTDFDIIHLHCVRSYQNIVISKYALKNSVPYIMDQHGSLPRRVPGESGYKWVLRGMFDYFFGYRIMKNATKVIAQNGVAAREYKSYRVNESKIAIIPLFFNLSDYVKLPQPGEFRKRYGLTDKRIIMSFGRINLIKGLDFLVDSFAELARSRQDVMLAVVGPDDGFMGKLKEQIHELGIGDKVIFTGLLNGQEKFAALVDADVVVQPSRYEQAAWAPVEAVLCGTPVIVSNNTGSGEDISRMNAGYLVDYGNKTQMVETIHSILKDPSQAKIKVKKARKYITDNLQINTKVGEYEKLYQQCIKISKQN